MARLSGDLLTVLESAQAQAKYYGHAQVTEGHVALAILKRFPDVASRFWGQIDETDIVSRYLKGVEKGLAVATPPEQIIALLEKAAASGDKIHTLCKELSDRLGLAHPKVETSTTETPSKEETVSSTNDGSTTGSARVAAKGPIDPQVARKSLGEAVVGQDEAITRVVDRLILTRANLDLNPLRPDGVFLFAGPTGVGKTALAKALARFLSPAQENFIRLDMSEYRDPNIGLAKLIGSGPGYVGYDQPDGWLTTRLIKHPTSVVLLDEIEKAHPAIWTVFLQVFDDGRLTDGRGKTATFSDTVIVMTSNIGARNFESRPLGFRDRNTVPEASRAVISAVRKVMPPELFNRIDETIVFRPLDLEDIRQITTRELDRITNELTGRGYTLEYDDGVINYIAQLGYDPDLGARHLHRSIEQSLLVPLASRGPGKHSVSLQDGSLQWAKG